MLFFAVLAHKRSCLHTERHQAACSSGCSKPLVTLAPAAIAAPSWLSYVFCLSRSCQGSHGAELSSGLSAVAWDRIVRKGVEKDADAASPFRDLHDTDLGLAAYLREQGVQARCLGLSHTCTGAPRCLPPCSSEVLQQGRQGAPPETDMVRCGTRTQFATCALGCRQRAWLARTPSGKVHALHAMRRRCACAGW